MVSQIDPSWEDKFANQIAFSSPPVKAHGVSTPNVVVGLALGYGGMCQSLAEFYLGQTLGVVSDNFPSSRVVCFRSLSTARRNV